MITRRNFLSTSGAVATGAWLGRGRAEAQATTARRIVDVHHHFLPPYYQELAVEMGGEPQKWTPEMSFDRMDAIGLETAMLSISNWIAGAREPNAEQCRRLCRECNDYGAKMVAQYPKRFGFLASLMTLPDLDASLKEVEYAMDTLKADGIGLMSHYGHGLYLGDPALNPLFEEMNRRRVVAFVHPMEPWYNYRFDRSKNPVKFPSLAASELPIDTTRAVLNVLQNRVPEKYPNIKFIWAHAGGTSLMFLSRASAVTNDEKTYKAMYDRLAKSMASFYYDLTNTISPPSIHAVLAVAPPSHLLFGSDIPRGGNGRFTADLLAELPHTGVAAADVPRIHRGNAEALFPRLKRQS